MSDKKQKFGKLEEREMREFWAHEAHDFTPWLAENISELGDALEIELRVKQTEHAVGRYSLDILAEEVDTGRIVAIENQFHHTDHSHLGQLLTYAAGCDSDILVWIVEKVRDEHRAAVEWLNRKTDTETHFYLVQVKVWQIGDSLPAYQFIPVVASNKWQKEVHKKATALSSEDEKSIAYFNAFEEALEERKEEFPYERRKLYKYSIPHRHYNCDINGRKWFYGHAVRDGYALVFIHFAYEGKGVKQLLEKLHARNSFALEPQDGWNWESAGISHECSLSDGEEKLAEVRKWAVDSIIKLAEAIPPEMLQEIADAVEAEEDAE